MNQEVKEKWLAALRSGKYKQGIGGLCKVGLLTEDKYYCCLGVLSDIYAKEHNLEWESYVSNYLRVLDESVYLPKPVQKWAELVNENPYIYNIGVLSSINDRGINFNDIADLIERYL